ncbi:MAG: adenylosuccinate lyase [Candidatus Nanohalarchaeota archaeon]|nr:MAG: adenylosuccinate lyase [Candidatus Nanohaloarchaeota archaeon]
MNHSNYNDALADRYAGKEMTELFSDEVKFQTWRKCWIALAEAERELGLEDIISKEAIEEMKKNTDNINFKDAEEKEKQIKHDVMAHVWAYSKQCPKAAKIIHLGATSQFVGCNTDLILQKKAIDIVKKRLVNVIFHLMQFAKKYKALATLGYTHFQPAQPTTIGKRATLYIADLLLDLKSIEFAESLIKAKGAKGTVGTQASFLELFGGNKSKVKQLDLLIAKKLGFDGIYEVTGQTYSRKIDTKISEALAGIACSAYKFASDMRLAAHLKIMEEPYGKSQTGSSAMPYKRNPMHSERMCALSRILMNMPAEFYMTHSNQWFERTLDDSAARRVEIPRSFLLADSILLLYESIASGIIVYPAQVKLHLTKELPFMAIEEILMKCAKQGKSRQEMHEILKKHALEAGNKIKKEGAQNDFFSRIAKDSRIPLSKKELDFSLENPGKFTGTAESQTEEFIRETVAPVLRKHKNMIEKPINEIEV